MTDLEALESMFSTGRMLGNDRVSLSFEGVPWKQADGLAALEAQLGYTIPAEIATFLRCFGGTRLFVDSYGLGTEILPICEIESANLKLQEGEKPFWPNFAIVGFDSAGDMLCMYNEHGTIHFGNLDHAAWGSPDLWVSEALTFAPFDKWLRMFVESTNTLPSKAIKYEI